MIVSMSLAQVGKEERNKFQIDVKNKGCLIKAPLFFSLHIPKSCPLFFLSSICFL